MLSFLSLKRKDQLEYILKEIEINSLLPMDEVIIEAFYPVLLKINSEN